MASNYYGLPLDSSGRIIVQQPSSGLTTRSVQTVAVDPVTGQPITPGTYAPSTGAITPVGPYYDPRREMAVPGLVEQYPGPGVSRGDVHDIAFKLIPNNFADPPGTGGLSRIHGGFTWADNYRNSVVDHALRRQVGLEPTPTEVTVRGGRQVASGGGYRAPTLNRMPAVPVPQRAIGTNGYAYVRNPNGGWTNVGSAVPGLTGAGLYNAMSASAYQPQPRASGVSTNGYVYQNGQRVGQADWAQGMSPSDQYAAANARGAQQAAQAAGYGSGSGSAYNPNWATGETSGSPFW